MDYINVYRQMIPVKPLSNWDLNHYADALNIRSFRGTFMRDNLPKKINRTECAIVNLDDTSGPGTHWVCYYSNEKESFYFDSYGLDPPDEIVDYLKNFPSGYGKPLHYNTTEI